MKTALKSITLCSLGALTLTACGIGGTPLRSEVADRIASPAWMVERQIPADPYLLTAFERMHERGKPATLYIEGDGMKAARHEAVDYDPTPKNPVALHLASKDKVINLAYIAQPCQYSGMLDTEKECTAADYAESLDALNFALHKMKRRYGITSFNVVGYDSGATLAALLAATRNDINSLRTVSPEFDLETLKPQRVPLTMISQHHFTGGQDTVNRPKDIHAYLQMLGKDACVETTFIQEASHEEGFVDKWPDLLSKGTPLCEKPYEPQFTPIEKPEPIFYPRMSGSKK